MCSYNYSTPPGAARSWSRNYCFELSTMPYVNKLIRSSSWTRLGTAPLWLQGTQWVPLAAFRAFRAFVASSLGVAKRGGATGSTAIASVTAEAALQSDLLGAESWWRW